MSQTYSIPSKGKVKLTAPYHVEDLNQLPTPDFDGLPLQEYLAPKIVLPYNLGKGCYWGSCYFCEIPFINKIPGNEYRVKDVKLIVDQLQELSEKYETPYFQFTDEVVSSGCFKMRFLRKLLNVS